MCAGTTSKCLPQLDGAFCALFEAATFNWQIWIHLLQSVELHAKHPAIWLQWYLWKFETRIGLDSLHSGLKRFARHLIWTFLTLILFAISSNLLRFLVWLETAEWKSTLQPNSFWCFKKSIGGIATSLHSLPFFASQDLQPKDLYPWSLTASASLPTALTWRAKAPGVLEMARFQRLHVHFMSINPMKSRGHVSKKWSDERLELG